MKTLVVVGNDKLGNKAIQLLDTSDNVQVLVDRSTNLSRIWNLLRKQKIKFSLLSKMACCEFLRDGNSPPKSFPGINSNKDLLRTIASNSPSKMVLFRAGLIINSKVLSTGIDILNIHCARIPTYGGIGAINKALVEEDFEQEACLHRVIASVDSGEVLLRLPYKLDKNLSYCENEKIAYDAGLSLLTSVLTE
ncbi:Phosphoribosylglycinamide formyltransferase [Halomicronema hongdechloris C2206]|uniref:Phosphoribosylglycinamide formyltransferase n=1 Tax=Halomicronema hongdechloris C2206 TaxID=1641165 RepID=A0A1Z3HL51_9CYAN|nr:formyltransferase family protein [Halomicronema hongdechloris]ASC70817.1 Phosphoribosylglycinamide formyltransferase [Halomicronema hongdechloris C2206]